MGQEGWIPVWAVIVPDDALTEVRMCETEEEALTYAHEVEAYGGKAIIRKDYMPPDFY